MSNASDYADSLATMYAARVDAGAPFGIQHDIQGWADVDGAEYLDWRDNVETEWDEASAMDYLSDALDIQYIVSSDREYRGALVLVGLGGPNVWINTMTGNLEVSWWSAVEYRGLPSGFIDGLDVALSELWEMGA